MFSPAGACSGCSLLGEQGQRRQTHEKRTQDRPRGPGPRRLAGRRLGRAGRSLLAPPRPRPLAPSPSHRLRVAPPSSRLLAPIGRSRAAGFVAECNPAGIAARPWRHARDMASQGRLAHLFQINIGATPMWSAFPSATDDAVIRTDRDARINLEGCSASKGERTMKRGLSMALASLVLAGSLVAGSAATAQPNRHHGHGWRHNHGHHRVVCVVRHHHRVCWRR